MKVAVLSWLTQVPGVPVTTCEYVNVVGLGSVEKTVPRRPPPNGSVTVTLSSTFVCANQMPLGSLGNTRGRLSPPRAAPRAHMECAGIVSHSDGVEECRRRTALLHDRVVHCLGNVPRPGGRVRTGRVLRNGQVGRDARPAAGCARRSRMHLERVVLAVAGHDRGTARQRADSHDVDTTGIRCVVVWHQADLIVRVVMRRLGRGVARIRDY